ncbi:MAG TPA: hypothetical protein VFG79_08605 [Solirubrobacter sp.]|nr:hypothetical protein [Solirubrobacter sp.]
MLLGAMFGAISPAQATFPGRNGAIGFGGGFGCGFEVGAIGLIRPDGSQRRQVSACGDYWYGPVWSPDGRSFLAAGPHDIFRLRSDGSHQRRVTAGTMPSFAPDGRHLVYARGTNGRREIWRSRIDGRGARRLRDRTPFAANPIWSPQGDSIAYLQHKKGVWLIDARTGRLIRKLTKIEMFPLDWSPDGRRILCARFSRGSLLGDPPADLYVVRADASGSVKRLTRTPDTSESAAGWSPDGRRIVVLSTTEPVPGRARTTMVTMTTRLTRRHRIWTTPIYDPYDESLQLNVPIRAAWQPLPGGAAAERTRARRIDSAVEPLTRLRN